MNGAAKIERQDQRLHDGDGAVVGPGIAPGFQEMRFGNVPLAQFRGLVGVEPHVDAQLHFRHALGEVEIHGRVVDRIAADDDEGIDFAGVHVGDQFVQAFDIVDRVRIERVGVD